MVSLSKLTPLDVFPIALKGSALSVTAIPSNCLSPHLKRVSTFKGMNLLPFGANSFLFKWTHFSEEAFCTGQEVTKLKLYFFCKMAEISPSVTIPFK